MKKTVAKLLAVVVASAVMVGCVASSSTVNRVNDASSASSESTTKAGNLRVVTTIFPVYDWTNAVLGEQADSATITWLENSGVDVHSYEPSVSDIATISECDVFVYVGGDSDEWVDGVLDNATNPDMIVIDLMDELEHVVREEVMVEGMQTDHDHDDCDDDHDHDEDCDEHHDHDEDCDDDHDHDHEEDEHIWLSLNNAALATQIIADALARADAENADVYASNAQNYISQLNDLNTKYQTVVADAVQTTLLFADRFPFLYMLSDYGLDYYAAFSGCSAETEASFETIVFLANKVDECGISVILTTEDSNDKIAKTVISSTQAKDQSIMVLDSMQSVTSAEVDSGANYLAIMERNLETLTKAVQ